MNSLLYVVILLVGIVAVMAVNVLYTVQAAKPTQVWCFSSEIYGHQTFCGWSTNKECKVGRESGLGIYPDATKCFKEK